MLLLATTLALGAVASTCPSKLGAGQHTIRLQLPDAADPSIVWERAFDVVVPASRRRSRRPALFMWHGCGSDPEKFRLESEMHLRASQSRWHWFTVWPRGTSASLTPATQHTCISTDAVSCGWNSAVPGPGGCDVPTSPYPDDVAFASAILAWMRGNLCLDEQRIFTAGFSNGGSMTCTHPPQHPVCMRLTRACRATDKLNCELPGPFAGIMTLGSAASAAATPGGATGCAPAKNLPALNMCGSADSCYGAEGGSLRSQLTSWAAWNNCSGTIVETELSTTSYCLIAEGCPASLPVQACAVRGLGHCWPNVPGAGDAPCQNQDPENMDASSYVLSFFASVEPAGGRPLTAAAIASITVLALLPSIAFGGACVAKYRDGLRGAADASQPEGAAALLPGPDGQQGVDPGRRKSIQEVAAKTVPQYV